MQSTVNLKQSDSSKSELSIQYMKEEDLDMVMNWCKEEKWNVGKYDAVFFHRFDPTGHLLFLENNIPIGAISIVRYSSQLFAIGSFIVKKEYRKKGYGMQIWQYAMELLEKNVGAATCLYAVPAQISRYANFGFKKYFQLQRWQKRTENSVVDKDGLDEEIKHLNEIPFESIIEYDQSIFSASRKKLLAEFIQCQEVKGFVSTNETGKVTGFGIIRPCIDGFRIGPLYADHMENAQKLFHSLLSNVNHSTVFIDSPTNNPYIEAFIQYFNLDRVLGSDTNTTAMLKGDIPPSWLENKHKNYAVCSLEVG